MKIHSDVINLSFQSDKEVKNIIKNKENDDENT